MKTPEEMAKKWAWEKTYTMTINDGPCSIAEKGWLAGYQAAKSEYEAKIKELEIELDNWKHAATHGDEGL